MNGFTIENASPLLMATLLALMPALSSCGGEGNDGDEDDSDEGGRSGEAGDDEAGRAGAGAGRGGRGATGEGGTIGILDGGAGETGGGGGAGGGAGGGTGGGGDSGGGSDAGNDDAARACNARAQEHEHDSSAAMHVEQPLPASSYNSSPPSSGPHCDEWGQYTVFADPPLPACNFLHNLEHGAVALLYNCPDGCADLVEQLEQVIADAPADPDCGSAKRLLLTPYAEMDATIAAAAWGYTFTADCLDEAARAALTDFITAHQGSAGDAPEAAVCAQGTIGP